MKKFRAIGVNSTAIPIYTFDELNQYVGQPQHWGPQNTRGPTSPAWLDERSYAGVNRVDADGAGSDVYCVMVSRPINLPDYDSMQVCRIMRAWRCWVLCTDVSIRWFE
jgi:hypothetical protein